jgi:hypothetical protein
VTTEQEQAIEALSLRDGGFAATRGEVETVQTPRARYLVTPEGDACKVTEVNVQGFRSLMAEVYGRGATA